MVFSSDVAGPTEYSAAITELDQYKEVFKTISPFKRRRKVIDDMGTKLLLDLLLETIS